MLTPVPGEICLVAKIPLCDFCKYSDAHTGTLGPYDFASRYGWAHGCERHWIAYRSASGLGVGKAQLWVTQDQIDDPEFVGHSVKV